MKIDLTGKTALVTGSTLGIGYAIAKGLAEAGAEVIVNGRKQQAVDEAVTRLKAKYPARSCGAWPPTSAARTVARRWSRRCRRSIS